MVWWFNTKVALQQKTSHHSHGGSKHSNSGGGGSNGGGGVNGSGNTQASQNACASLCDEIVTLWKLAALNPSISPAERATLRQRLVDYHLTVVEKVQVRRQLVGCRVEKRG